MYDVNSLLCEESLFNREGLSTNPCYNGDMSKTVSNWGKYSSSKASLKENLFQVR